MTTPVIDADYVAALEALLDAAAAHLEYAGYGDRWERECATADKLPERIAAYTKTREWQQDPSGATLSRQIGTITVHLGDLVSFTPAGVTHRIIAANNRTLIVACNTWGYPPKNKAVHRGGAEDLATCRKCSSITGFVPDKPSWP